MNTQRRRAMGAAVGLIGAMLAGCATVYEGKYPFSDGWRKARVEEIGAASALTQSSLNDCRSSATAEQLATRTYALLSYVDFNHRRTRIVALPPGANFKTDSLVYVKLRSCAGNVALQIAAAP
jgi:hypothetical protein